VVLDQPQSHSAVQTTRNDVSLVGTDIRANYDLVLQKVGGDPLSSMNIPNTGLLIIAAREQCAIIWAKRDKVNPIGVRK
jgi:hypothetical protein